MTGAIKNTTVQLGFSRAGRHHLENDRPCQDAHIWRDCGNFVLAAVADGVGSAAHSEIGSSLAVQTLADFCSNALAEIEQKSEISDVFLSDLLCKGFQAALDALLAESERSQLPLSDYDTTLTALIYNQKAVYIGQCGDGGIIGLTPEGRHIQLTTVQKGDAWNEVLPLRSGSNHWAFKKMEIPFHGFLLLTDGLLDIAAPPLLSQSDDPLYHAFIQRFFNAQDTLDNVIAYLESPECIAITDDMTAVVVTQGPQSEIDVPPDYFEEPDWRALRLKRYSRLYPHLKMEEAEHASERHPLDGQSK